MLLEDVVAVLVAGGMGTAGTDVVAGSLPEEPLEAIAVRQYGGSQAVSTLGEGHLADPKVRKPRFQVAVRNPNQLLAWQKAEQCRALLENWLETSIGGCLYLQIVPIGDLGEITEDDNLGCRVVGSYEAWKEPD